MNQSQLARELGISRARVCQLVAEGMPLDLAGAVAWRRRNLFPSWTAAEPIDRVEARAASAELKRERAKLARAERLRLEMLTAYKRGELVNRKKVVEALQVRLLPIPNRCAALAPIGKFLPVVNAIESEITRAVKAFKADLDAED